MEPVLVLRYWLNTVTLQIFCRFNSIHAALEVVSEHFLSAFYTSQCHSGWQRCKLSLHITVQGVGLHCTVSLEHSQTNMHWICGGKHNKGKNCMMKSQKKCTVSCAPSFHLSVHVNSRLYIQYVCVCALFLFKLHKRMPPFPTTCC